ncbi:MAG: RHS repeat domain-containing protein [Ruthenibacterium lactatiformans]
MGAQLPSGKSITYDYDALDALVQKSYSTGEADVLYSYSPDGNLVSMRDATGDSTYTYDANGRLVSYTNAFSATVKLCLQRKRRDQRHHLPGRQNRGLRIRRAGPHGESK